LDVVQIISGVCVALNCLKTETSDGLRDAAMAIEFHEDKEFLGQLKVHTH
jgi:hypothetical protein